MFIKSALLIRLCSVLYEAETMTHFENIAGIFLGTIWGRINPFQIKNEQKLPKMVYIIPNFFNLSSTFLWKFNENLNKNSKVTDAWKFS